MRRNSAALTMETLIPLSQLCYDLTMSAVPRPTVDPPKRKARKLRCLAVAAALLFSAPLQAQDVHVRVSPDLTAATADNTGFPTIQMALDHSPQPGPAGRLYIEIAPESITSAYSLPKTGHEPRCSAQEQTLGKS